ncbi:hypothetical protein G3T36_19040 [Diaminobutyricibacter tongyongensis]|uniref:Uncharacterized protein n=1 Tax=Leifsonia tongyongensis TaxID=1268043 RepID=A0A6L9Y452_9MICO|nr:hypothetical protein [Diaminobutyricibacter tongyongensis]NEN07958.1 hypothetical protein [Diaminobutyricibacter tongyongensis]
MYADDPDPDADDYVMGYWMYEEEGRAYLATRPDLNFGEDHLIRSVELTDYGPRGGTITVSVSYNLTPEETQALIREAQGRQTLRGE